MQDGILSTLDWEMTDPLVLDQIESPQNFGLNKRVPSVTKGQPRCCLRGEPRQQPLSPDDRAALDYQREERLASDRRDELQRRWRARQNNSNPPI